MRLSYALFCLAAVAPLAVADVKFTSPAAAASIPGGTTFPVKWADSGEAPSLTDLSSYTLFLFSGSNAAPVQLYQLSTGTFAAGNTVSVTVPLSIGGPGINA